MVRDCGSPLGQFIADADEVKSLAKDFPKRRSDQELYGLLSSCLRLAARCDAEGLLEPLKTIVIQRAKDAGIKRPYFEKGADAPLVVGRYIFEGEKARAATWRYTAALREARKRQIAPEQLAGWLSEKGGINALFKTRPVAARSHCTKVLHLRQSIEVPKGENFTITLRGDGTNFFDVISNHPNLPAKSSTGVR